MLALVLDEDGMALGSVSVDAAGGGEFKRTRRKRVLDDSSLPMEWLCYLTIFLICERGVVIGEIQVA